jgi:hypothetical protein
MNFKNLIIFYKILMHLNYTIKIFSFIRKYSKFNKNRNKSRKLLERYIFHVFC